MVKKNPFTTSSQVKKTLQEVSVSLSKSTIKRRLFRANKEGSPQGANKARSAGRILKYIAIYRLPRFSQIQQS